MRKFSRTFFGIAAVIACLACAVFAYALARMPLFDGNGYEFSVRSSSSAQIVRTDSPYLYKLFHRVAGESARFSGNAFEPLRARFRAEVVFTEESCGVVNYYCFSPLLGKGIALCGEEINLHIAVGKEQTAVGSPIIFGGF